MRARPFRFVLVPFVCSLLGLTACQPGKPENTRHEFSGITMGTTYSVVINNPSLPVPRQRLQTAIAGILAKIDAEMSTYLPDSELMRINKTDATDWLPIDESLLHVLQTAQKISRLTSGAFDVTSGPVVNLWGFGPGKETRVPTESQVNAALEQVGYEKLLLDSVTPAIKKRTGRLFIDLSGIAKGYGVDKVADYLEQLKLDNYVVEIGGEIRARGVNSKNVPWQIGIEKPVAGQRAVQRIIKLANIAMATSGDYRNFFEKDGTRYSHVLNPVTGRPVTHGLVSVTVLHPSTTAADALATGLLVSGLEQGFALALKHDIAAYFITTTDAGFKERLTPKFEPYLVANK